MDFLTEITIDGIALWVVLLICIGVFIASIMDGIAGGGGIISLPTYIMAFHGLPMYYMHRHLFLHSPLYQRWFCNVGAGSSCNRSGAVRVYGWDLASTPYPRRGVKIYAADRVAHRCLFRAAGAGVAR